MRLIILIPILIINIISRSYSDSNVYKWGFGWDNGITLRRDINEKVTLGGIINPTCFLNIKNFKEEKPLDLDEGNWAIHLPLGVVSLNNSTIVNFY